MDSLVVAWIFSCVLAWAFTGSATSLGDTIESKGYRSFIRLLAFSCSLTAILLTIALIPSFTTAIIATGFQGVTGGAAYGFILWSAIHLSGALYTVSSLSIKLASNTL